MAVLHTAFQSSGARMSCILIRNKFQAAGQLKKELESYIQKFREQFPFMLGVQITEDELPMTPKPPNAPKSVVLKPPSATNKGVKPPNAPGITLVKPPPNIQVNSARPAKAPDGRLRSTTPVRGSKPNAPISRKIS